MAAAENIETGPRTSNTELDRSHFGTLCFVAGRERSSLFVPFSIVLSFMSYLLATNKED